MGDQTSQMIGKYQLLNKIGEGGFGIVYKANDTTLDRLVALKQLKAELSSSPEYLERFKQESRLMGSLNHPNIVKMLEVFEDAGRYFIVMDYMPNGSLTDKLIKGEPLSLDQTLEILKPIAKAIDYAHSKNLIHRDIKPSNILFMEGDEPVLSDFGLVKSMDTKGLTTTGMTIGTPEYMAPEQILGKELTPATDLYAFGVVAYQMLTGELPFKGNTPFEIQEGHVHKELPDIVEQNEALPVEFSAVFKMALEKKPEERFASAKDFVHELDSVSNGRIAEEREEKLQEIQEKIGKKDFSNAAILLTELISAHPDDEVKQKLKEVKRRAGIWEEYQSLEKQSVEINQKLADLEARENWIEEEGEEDSEIDDSADEDPEDENTPKEHNWKPFAWIGVCAVIINIFIAIFAPTSIVLSLILSLVLLLLTFFITL